MLDKPSQAPLLSSPAQSKMLHNCHDICSNISPVACVKHRSNPVALQLLILTHFLSSQAMSRNLILTILKS